MGRDSNPGYREVHTLSKRAQSTTLPPIRKKGKIYVTAFRGLGNLCLRQAEGFVGQVGGFHDLGLVDDHGDFDL